MIIEISVLVATKNRREHILSFLNRLNTIIQEPPWELIIIDNGSSDGTSEAIKKFNHSFPLVLLQEEIPGKSRALNKGMLHAKGNLLIFTDDDIIPDPNWLSAMHKASCEHKEKFIFGGRVKVDTTLLPKWIATSYNLKGILSSEHDFGDDSFVYPVEKFPIGPNMAVRRNLIDENRGGWPIDLGPGTSLPLGDERSFLDSLNPKKEIDRLYTPESIVWHIPEKEQLVFYHALKRCFQCGLVQARLDIINEFSGNDSPSVGSLIRSRLSSCKSAREFCCITIRALGVVVGRLTKKREKAFSAQVTRGNNE